MEPGSSSISVTVSHRGQNFSLSFLPDDTLLLLRQHLEELTSVPPSLQKLLYKGSKNKYPDGDQTLLSHAGIKDGTKIQLIGTTTKQLDGLKAEEGEQQRRERIMRERASKAPTKARALLEPYPDIF
ncbi:hypothetical protein VNI00_003053 [Paramarasmius palmivorus]|uniref:Ubiquitin-like domain-containing protein n=1 Tax=Paramarasmius palmivorus TaxID=297713 RepID=A0AAW0DXQ8_9AGAR